VFPSTATLLLSSLAAAPSATAAEAQALAGAVRAYYDDGAESACEQLSRLHADAPDRDDIAWWFARCSLDLGRHAQAVTLLDARDGENIPAWRFPALAVQAALAVGEPARADEAAAAALAAAPEQASSDALLIQVRWARVGLAARAGDDDAALAQLSTLADAPAPELLLQAALPELDRVKAAPLAGGCTLSASLLAEADGRWWRLPAGGGLARVVDAPVDAVIECAGPDLCDADGQPLLPEPGVRWTPSTVGDELLYGAGREPFDPHPDEPGLFAYRAGARPIRLLDTPELAQDQLPAMSADGALFFVRTGPEGGRLMRLLPDEDALTLAPDLRALSSLVVVGDTVVVAAVHEGVSQLRCLPVDAAPEQGTAALLDAPFEAWRVRSP